VKEDGEVVKKKKNCLVWMRAATILQWINILMNLLSMFSILVLKVLYDFRFSIDYDMDSQMEKKFYSKTSSVIFTKGIILFDCTVIVIASFSFLSTLVHHLPDQFKFFLNLLQYSMNSSMLAIWCWSLYLTFSVAVLTRNLMGYYAYGWHSYLFAV